MADITIPTELLRIVDDHGLMTLEMASFINLVGALAIAEGTGSPEGVLAAKVSKLYMDTSGPLGNVLYVKQFSDIGGIASLGWVDVASAVAPPPATLELFQARKVSSQDFGVPFADVINWNFIDKEDSPYSFDLATGVLTINSIGWYSLSTHMEAEGSGTRSGMFTRLFDTAGIDDTFVSTLWRSNANEFPTCDLASFLYEVTATPATLRLQGAEDGFIAMTRSTMTVMKVA